MIKNITILAALRTATENTEAGNRLAPQPTKPRNPKRQKVDTDGTAESPSVPSPGSNSAVNKLKGQNVMRSVSVPRQQQAAEVVVKLEDGVGGAEALKGLAGEKAGKFFIGAEVAYRQTKPKEDGSQWIQCNITNVTGDGNKKRCVLSILSSSLSTAQVNASRALLTPATNQVRGARPRTRRERPTRTNLQDRRQCAHCDSQP